MSLKMYRHWTLVISLVICIFISEKSHAMEYRYFYESMEEEQIKSDLSFLFSIKSAVGSPLHLEIFGGMDGLAYKNFLESRIKIIRRSNSATNAFAFSVDGYRDTIAVTSKFFELPQILRISVLIHEARHSESDHMFWRHIACPNPYLDENGNEMISSMDGNVSLSGETQACDSDVKGSFGIVAVMLKNISENCENCTLELKDKAGILFQDIKKRISDPTERHKLD